MSSQGQSFRQRAAQVFIDRLGEPEVLESEAGAIYRWVLRRRQGLNVHVTFDSPELPNLAHVIVSDPLATEVEPVASLTMRTMAEVNAVIDRILQQWKAHETIEERTASQARPSGARRQ